MKMPRFAIVAFVTAWTLIAGWSDAPGVQVAPASAQSMSVETQRQSALDRPDESAFESHPQAACTEVCTLSEACIDARCLPTCSPACREGTYCAPTAECLPLPNVRQEEATEGELIETRGAQSADSRLATLVDVGGIIFLGARPTVEWGEHHAFHVRLSFMNTGFMTYKVEQQTEFERFQWGFGAEFGYRLYEERWSNLRGFYYGGGVSYSAVGVSDLDDQIVESITHYPGIYGEFGYRWVFKDLVFGFGPALGVRVPVYTHFRSLGPGSCAINGDCDRDNEARFEGTMVVEVGWLQ